MSKIKLSDMQLEEISEQWSEENEISSEVSDQTIYSEVQIMTIVSEVEDIVSDDNDIHRCRNFGSTYQ